MMCLGDGAQARSIPPPHEEMNESDKSVAKANPTPMAEHSLGPMYNVLSPIQQRLHT
jgi:hypothetical protein